MTSARRNRHAELSGRIEPRPESDLIPLVEASENPLVLILDCIKDPHNLGACLRTADAAAVDAVIAPKDKSFAFEILQIFEQQTLELIQKLPNLQFNKETEKLNKLVHKYKSSAKNVGNEPLSKLCCRIEQATRNTEPKWDEIEPHCSTLIADCKKLMEELPSILLKLENS